MTQPLPTAAAPAGAAPVTAEPAGAVQLARDLVALAKPRLSSLVLFTTLGGYYLAPVTHPRTTTIALLVGTALVVAGANALNMYIERDSDGLMNRTRRRPLPAGRLAPRTVLVFGVVLAVVAIPVIAVWVNPLTATLGVVAFASYVLAYTPMKRRTSLALLVGAIPGAIPPLMGWTAATGRLQVPGFVLFAILFLWQVPHFLAIALYSYDDYARGGIQVVPLVKGVDASKRQVLAYTAALVPVSLLLYPLRIAGPIYLVVALVSGLAFFAFGAWGLRASSGRDWARGLFAFSLVYLTVLFIVLGIEPLLG